MNWENIEALLEELTSQNPFSPLRLHAREVNVIECYLEDPGLIMKSNNRQ